MLINSPLNFACKYLPSNRIGKLINTKADHHIKKVTAFFSQKDELICNINERYASKQQTQTNEKMKKLLLLLLLCVLSISLQAQSPAIYAERTGAGKPLLLLPGFACPGEVWDETIENLPVGYAFHRFTYAGFGGKEPVPMPWYEQLLDGLIAYVRDEGLENITLIGHSMGGNLALDLARHLPDKVEKLVLIDVLPCMRAVMMPGVQAEHISYDSPYNRQMLQMPEAHFRQSVEGMAERMTIHPEKQEKLLRWMMKADRTTFVQGYTDLLKPDQRDILPEIQAAVLILGATYPDAKLARKTLEDQYASLPDKHLHMAPDSRHFIMWDAPGWTLDQINSFLQ